MTPNLPLGNWPDPTKRHVNPNRDDPNDPENFPKIHPIIPEYDRKYDPSEIPACPGHPTDNTISMWVDMRDQPKIRSIACF